MKHVSGIFTIAFLLTTTLLAFQNCGKKDQVHHYSSEEINDIDENGEPALVGEGSEVVKAIEGNDVRLTVSSNILKLIAKDGVVCEWGFFAGTSSEVLKLSEKTTSLFMDKIETSEAGRYHAKCSDGKKQIIYVFVVDVQKKTKPPGEEKASLEVTLTLHKKQKVAKLADSAALDAAFKELAKLTTSTRTIGNLTKAAALAQCKDIASKTEMLTKINCKWKSSAMHSQNLSAEFAFESIKNGKTSVLFKATLAYDAALKQCQDRTASLKKSDVKAGLVCRWNKVPVLSVGEVLQAETTSIVFYSLDGKVNRSALGTLIKDAALTKCKAAAKGNVPAKSYVYMCQWGNQIIGTGSLEGSFVIQKVKKGAATVISKAVLNYGDAKKECEVRAAKITSQDLLAGYRCFWKDHKILEQAEKAYLTIAYTHINNSQSISSVGVFTEAQAVGKCREIAAAGAKKDAIEFTCALGGKKILTQTFKREFVFQTRGGFAPFVARVANIQFVEAKRVCSLYKVLYRGFAAGYQCSWNGQVFEAGGGGGN